MERNGVGGWVKRKRIRRGRDGRPLLDAEGVEDDVSGNWQNYALRLDRVPVDAGLDVPVGASLAIEDEAPLDGAVLLIIVLHCGVLLVLASSSNALRMF